MSSTTQLFQRKKYEFLYIAFSCTGVPLVNHNSSQPPIYQTSDMSRLSHKRFIYSHINGLVDTDLISVLFIMQISNA